MSEMILNQPKTKDGINAYYDGARAAIKLYAVWRGGTQWVGMGRALKDALQDVENMRQDALTYESEGE